MKILWIDCETTGLNAKENGILTLAGIIEIDGIIKEEFHFKMKPFPTDVIDQGALDVNGITLEQMKTFEDPLVIHEKLIKVLSKYVNRYNKYDKLQPAGYNVVFDTNFLGEWFKKCEDKYFGAWIDYHKFDVATLVQFLHLKNALNLKNYRLATVAEYLKIPLMAHDALEDIRATKEICYKLLNMIEIKNDVKLPTLEMPNSVKKIDCQGIDINSQKGKIS